MVFLVFTILLSFCHQFWSGVAFSNAGGANWGPLGPTGYADQKYFLEDPFGDMESKVLDAYGKQSNKALLYLINMESFYDDSVNADSKSYNPEIMKYFDLHYESGCQINIDGIEVDDLNKFVEYLREINDANLIKSATIEFTTEAKVDVISHDTLEISQCFDAQVQSGLLKLSGSVSPAKDDGGKDYETVNTCMTRRLKFKISTKRFEKVEVKTNNGIFGELISYAIEKDKEEKAQETEENVDDYFFSGVVEKLGSGNNVNLVIYLFMSVVSILVCTFGIARFCSPNKGDDKYQSI